MNACSHSLASVAPCGSGTLRRSSACSLRAACWPPPGPLPPLRGSSSARSRTRFALRRSSRPRRRWRSSAWPDSAPSASRRYWTPGLDAPSDGELSVLKSVAGAAEMNGVRLYVTVMHPGSRTTPLTDDARAEFASYAATVVREAPYIRDVIVAQRAEPEPLLAPAVRARRLERVARRVPLAARARLRRPQGGVARRHRVRRRRLAARRRQPRRCPADALPDTIHP